MTNAGPGGHEQAREDAEHHERAQDRTHPLSSGSSEQQRREDEIREGEHDHDEDRHDQQREGHVGDAEDGTKGLERHDRSGDQGAEGATHHIHVEHVGPGHAGRRGRRRPRESVAHFPGVPMAQRPDDITRENLQLPHRGDGIPQIEALHLRRQQLLHLTGGIRLSLLDLLLDASEGPLQVLLSAGELSDLPTAEPQRTRSEGRRDHDRADVQEGTDEPVAE